MASNANVNKVVYAGETLIDLTADTITAADLAQGVTAHDKSGAAITGTLADGNYLSYGITDGTLPWAGVAVVGQATIIGTEATIGTAQAGYTTI